VTVSDDPHSRRFTCTFHGCRRARESGENTLENPRWAGRATRNHNIDRNDVRDSPAAGIALSKYAARAAAVAQGDHELRIGCGLIGSTQRYFHVFRHGACDQQHIGVPRACDKPNAESFKVVERIIESVDLELTAVTRAGVDVADAQRAAEHGTNVVLQAIADTQAFICLRRWLGDDADRCNLAKCFQHEGALQIMAAVGEVEGLVDEREVRDDVADDGMLEHGPVLPRGVVRVTAADCPGGTGFECN
jgi:hypothetical protein